jgi:hypothetical protein
LLISVRCRLRTCPERSAWKATSAVSAARAGSGESSAESGVVGWAVWSRWDHADRLWLTALSRLVDRRRWAEIFPVTPATILRWHRSLVARKWTFTDRRLPGRPATGVSIKTLILQMARENPT